MAWITLALRKQTLKAQISDLNYEDIQLSREQRAVHRHLSYEESVFNNNRKQELRSIKEPLEQVREKRKNIGVDDPQYKQWQTEYSQAQEDYQSKKQDIEDYYDSVNAELEADAQDQEDHIQEEITRVETQRDAMNAELQAITDQVKQEIENNAIKF